MFRWTFRQKAAMVAVLCALLLSAMVFLQSSQPSQAAQSDSNTVSVWLTTADLQTHLAQQGAAHFSTGSASGMITITVNEDQTDQQVDGFGASLTDGTRMPTSRYDAPASGAGDTSQPYPEESYAWISLRAAARVARVEPLPSTPAQCLQAASG